MDHVVAVAGGVTRSVFEIEQWVGPRDDGRWAFQGREINDGEVHDAYVGMLGKRVPFADHSQNPLHYWPQGPPS